MSGTDAGPHGRGIVSAWLELKGEGQPANEVDAAVRRLADGLVEDDPVLATGLGLTEGMDRLPSWSADALAARARWLHEQERSLEPLLDSGDVSTAVDAFAGLQIVHRLLRALELRRVAQRRPGAYLDVVSGLYPLLVRDLGTPEQRLDALASRLQAVPGLLEEAKQNLEQGLAASAVRAAADYAEGLLDLTGPTVKAFADQIGQGGALDAASAAACRALEDYRTYLQEELAPTAAGGSAAGRDVIEDVLRWEHVLDESPEDLAAYGREVLATTKEAMTRVAAEMGYARSADAVAIAAADHPPAGGVVAAYDAAVRRARDYLLERDIVSLPPGEELEVTATPAFLRSLLPFAAYEMPGPFMERQLGYYFVTPPPDGLTGEDLEEALRVHPHASLPTTGVHEAYPGHHLQLVWSNRAPTLARRLAAVPDGGSLLIEGWAFYCEELMEREGFLSEPAVRLMRLNDQVWRACRVILDIELHLGLIDLESAVELLSGETHMRRHEAELECLGYAEEPGWAMSYLLGKREVMRLAKSWRAARPGSLRDFHDALLSWGSLPPAVIAWGEGLGPRPAAARASS